MQPASGPGCLMSPGSLRNLPLEGAMSEMPMDEKKKNIEGGVVEYQDQTKNIREMVAGQNFTSLEESSFDHLLKTYGGL